jgi:hypothetical protein
VQFLTSQEDFSDEEELYLIRHQFKSLPSSEESISKDASETVSFPNDKNQVDTSAFSQVLMMETQQPRQKGKKVFVLLNVNGLGRPVQFLCDTGNQAGKNLISCELAHRLGHQTQEKVSQVTTVEAKQWCGKPREVFVSPVTPLGGKKSKFVPILVESWEKGVNILSSETLEEWGTIIDYPKAKIKLLGHQCDLLTFSESIDRHSSDDLVANFEKIVTSKERAAPTKVEVKDGLPVPYKGLTTPQLVQVEALLRRFRQVFQPLSVPPFGIRHNGKPVLRRIKLRPDFIPRRATKGPRGSPMATKVVKMLIEDGQMKLAPAGMSIPLTNPYFVVKKGSKEHLPVSDPKKYRLVVDAQVNSGVMDEVCNAKPLHEQAANLTRGGNRYFFASDAISFYKQFRYAEEDKKWTAIQVDGSMVVHNSLIEGMRGSGAHAQLSNTTIIFPQSVQRGLECYIDNYGFGEEEWSAFIDMLGLVLKEAAAANLRLAPDVTFIGYPEVNHAGYLVSRDGYRPATKYSQGLDDFASPGEVNRQQGVVIANSFLASAGVWQKHMAMYGRLAPVIRDFALGRSPAWTPEMESAFKLMKKEMASPRVLKAFDDAASETRLRCDFGQSSFIPDKHYISAVLLQLAEAKMHACGFFSRLLTEKEEKYVKHEASEKSVSTRGEGIAAAAACNRWYYLLRPMKSFIIETDAKNLSWYETANSEFQRSFRAFLNSRFESGQVEIRSRPRKLNAMADALGRGTKSTCEEVESVVFAVKSSLGNLKVFSESSRLPESLRFEHQHFTRKEQETMHKSKAFRLVGKSWMYIPTGGRPIRNVIPDSYIEEMIEWGHGDHLSLAQTEQRLSSYYAKNLVPRIKEMHRACSACQTAQGTTKKRSWHGTPFRAQGFGEIVFIDIKEVAGVIFLEVMDCMSRTVDVFELDDYSAKSVIKGMRRWLSNGAEGGEFFVDKAPSLNAPEVKEFAATAGYEIKPSPAPYGPEWVSPLERFNKEVNIFRRKRGDDDGVREWIHEVVRLYNKGESHVKGAERQHLKVGASPWISRTPLRSIAAGLDVDQETTDPMDIEVGHRVKVIAVTKNKGDPLFKIGVVKSLTSSTATVVYEGDAEEDAKTVSRRLITEIIPPARDEKTHQAQVGQWVVIERRRGPKIGLVLKTTRYSVECQYLSALNPKMKLAKRQWLPLWNLPESEDAGEVVSRDPPEDGSPVTVQVPWSRILYAGPPGPRNTLAPGVRKAFESASKMAKAAVARSARGTT